MTKRDPFFDVVKALVVMPIVIGHARWAYGCQVGNPMIDNFIVGMNMSLFQYCEFHLGGIWLSMSKYETYDTMVAVLMQTPIRTVLGVDRVAWYGVMDR